MKRAYYLVPIARCQALTQTKVRCSRDATHEVKGHALCAKHAEIAQRKEMKK